MKIIDLGIVRDNVDPLGIGRVRYSTYNELTGEIERAFGDYVEWQRKDRFVAKPLLPANINPIPEIGQAIMVIVFDSDKDTDNKFYIPGPFTSSHDLNKGGQNFQNQVTHTTFGLSNDFGQELFIASGENKGQYKDARTVGSIAKKEDYGIYGKYGSDVIFTNCGINLRGGKLLHKDFANDADKLALVEKPLMADRSATLHLKKFPHILEYQDQKTESISGATGQLKYIVEYDVDSFDVQQNINKSVRFFIYNVENAGSDFRIEKTNLNNVSLNDKCVLINHNNITFKNNDDKTTPTLKIDYLYPGIQCYVNIRNVIGLLHNHNLLHFDVFYSDSDLHPFYFRPTNSYKNTALTDLAQNTNRKNILDNVILFKKVQNGLVYAKGSPDPPLKTETKTEQVLAKSDKNQEQTFAAVKSDRIYLVSTDTNEYEKIIDFKKIDNYEPTQENYIRDIEPNTYALPRGEVLIDILKSMMDLFESHQHNLTDPLVKEDPNFVRLQNQINTLENDLLNNSIRIN
jgi:hypothetical protein